MALAKFYEENLEIMYERQIIASTRKKVYKKTTKKEIIKEKAQPKHFKDKRIVCKECGCVFLFSAKAQKAFYDKGWSEPKRCKDCREFRKYRNLMR